MKKLFLICSSLLVALMTNAAVINITPTSPYGENDNLRKAVYYATAGDEIILADGTYFEPSSGGYLELNKNITIKAAEGTHPIIQMEAYAKISNGANVSIEGLKFDGSVQGSYEYYFRFYDNSNTSLVLEGCEFYDVKNIVITGKAATHTNSLIVNNCYFHNNAKQSIYFEASNTEGRETCDELTITNSTFANTTALTNWISIIDIRPYGNTVTDAIKVIIDHCTFYNNPCVDSGHANIRTHYLSDVSISNSIFAHPTELAQRAVYCDTGGTVKNCLTFNFTKDTERYGISYGSTITNCFTADPLFTDAANGDFSFAGDWTTMTLSPARAAATDGSDLGDPRWYSAEVLPITNFASGYAFIGTSALLSGNIRLNANANIEYYNKDVCGTAKWKIHATGACYVAATLNMETGSSSGHKFKVEILGSDATVIGNLAEPAQSSSDGNIDLSGTIAIPAEGDYTIILSNLTAWSSAKIASVTLTTAGGGMIDLPGPIPFAEALFSARAYVDGDGLHFADAEHLGYMAAQWAKWNIHAEEGVYSFTANCTSSNYSKLTITVLDNEENELFSYTPQYSYTGDAVITSPKWYLPEGYYKLRLSNPNNHSDGYVTALSSELGTIITLDEAATDNSVIEANYNDGAKNVRLIRTITAGMYNTLCLPFAVSTSQVKAVFGNDVELKTLGDATIDGTVLDLQVNTATDIYQGTPVLIKTSADVVNPVFTNVTFAVQNPATSTGTNADFVGTFVASTILASPDNLFLAANNMLYFPTADIPIKGMRAYFRVHDAPAGVQMARFVERTMPTDVEAVAAQPAECSKTIQNGQLIITRDGVQYNAVGQRINK